MTQLVEPNVTETPSDTDLVAAVRRVLEASPEPLTVSKIRAALPTSLRTLSVEALTEVLARQVAANVLLQYPKYRSAQDRFWDRPMRVHVAQLLRSALADQPLAASELRRKLPDYAKTQAEAVLEEEVAQGNLFRHPPANPRSGPRFGAAAPDPKVFLRDDLGALFSRLGRLGFTLAQLREAALDILHDEEWGPEPEQSADAPAAQAPPAGARVDPAEPTAARPMHAAPTAGTAASAAGPEAAAAQTQPTPSA